MRLLQLQDMAEVATFVMPISGPMLSLPGSVWAFFLVADGRETLYAPSATQRSCTGTNIAPWVSLAAVEVLPLLCADVGKTVPGCLGFGLRCFSGQSRQLHMRAAVTRG